MLNECLKTVIVETKNILVSELFLKCIAFN